MNRLSGMTETYWSGGQPGQQWTQNLTPATVVSNVSYNSASQLSGITVNGWASETLTYNNLMQLTGINGLWMNHTYNYIAGQNNGRIASMTDSVTNETVTYQYDSLNRLIAANSTGGWNTIYTRLGEKGASAAADRTSLVLYSSLRDPSASSPAETGRFDSIHCVAAVRSSSGRFMTKAAMSCLPRSHHTLNLPPARSPRVTI